MRLNVDRLPVQAEWICESGKEWNGTRIVFLLEGKGGSTVMRFTHGGWATESEYFVSCNTTWGELMFRLKAAAEGKSQGPLFSEGDMGY